MSDKSRSGRRNNTNPESTRREILQAALEVLAKDGPESLSVTEVARRAGVNRGTAYQHFPTREDLAHATASWVSERIYDEFYGDMVEQSELSKVYPPDVALARLCNFAMNNPELSRAWLFDVMSTQGVVTDRFWKKYVKELSQFAEGGYGRENIDVEVFAFISLSSALLWPIWVGAHAKGSKARAKMQKRFMDEMMRLTLFGSLTREHYPELVERYSGPVDAEDDAAPAA
ncbi:TetR/AcrR family transcriptional regulator [Mangrovimicrobium sediminis]|nr:TetR/AcrR family transcriptional regulator [Haliea sp. SAOS-164]